MVSSLEPSKRTRFGSRSAASLAERTLMPMTVEAPMEGVTTNPEGGLFGFRVSKLRYLVCWLSIALATPSEPGLFEDEGRIVSPGCVTSTGAPVPSSSTSATCIQHPLFVDTVRATQR